MIKKKFSHQMKRILILTVKLDAARSIQVPKRIVDKLLAKNNVMLSIHKVVLANLLPHPIKKMMKKTKTATTVSDFL